MHLGRRHMLMGLGSLVGCRFVRSAPSIDPMTLSPSVAFRASNVTLSGPNVHTWPSEINSADNLNTISADPLFVASDSGSGNQPAVYLSGSTGLQAATPSRWKFEHDGSEWTRWEVVRVDATAASGQLHDTNNGTSGQPGYGYFVVNGASGYVDHVFGNGTETVFKGYRARKGSLPNTTAVHIVRHKSGLGLDTRVNAFPRQSDSALASYSSSNPYRALTLVDTKRYILEFGWIPSRLSDADVAAVERFLAAKYAVTLASGPYANIFYSGDSQVDCDSTELPEAIRATLAFQNVSERLLGINGQTTQQMVTRDVDRIDPFFDPKAAVNVAFGWEGLNSAYFGATAAQILSYYQNWCEDRQAAGFKTCLAGMLPSSYLPGGSYRSTVNNGLEAAVGTWLDALVMVHTDPDIGQDGDNTNATYFTDAVGHLNNGAGKEKALPYFPTAFDSLLPSP